MTAKKILISAICVVAAAAAEACYIFAVMMHTLSVDLVWLAVIPMIIVSAAVSLKVWRERSAKFKMVIFVLSMILNYVILSAIAVIYIGAFLMPTDFR